MGQLEGRVALVTGAGKRVGRALAEGLLAEGCDLLLLVHRSTEGADEVGALARGRGRRAEVFAADLTDRAATDASLDRALRTAEGWGGLDVVVHAAASYEKLRLAETTDADWDRVLETNLGAAFRLARRVAPALTTSRFPGGGSMLFLAETSAFVPTPSYFAHTVAKGALIPLARTLARELAPKARVNVLALGPVLPPEDFSEEERKIAFERIPMGDAGGPAEVVRAAVWLAGSERVTGEVVRIDGGRGLR